ncbi:MAG: DUF1295 domain-containing protein [Anaerolineales bacterium]|nr:DUF1295 domain-containing protein [Anaerolineales bacterium]
MSQADRQAARFFPLIVAVGLALAWTGSQGSVKVAGVPLFGLAVGLAYLIQWMAFLPAFRFQTEKFFDLTGSFTYIAITLLLVFLSPAPDTRSLLLAALIVIWAARLGSFLFLRIRRAGKDDRFDALKPFFWRFLNVWTLQGLWVSFTAGAAWAAMTAPVSSPLDGWAFAGFFLWGLGFLFEVVADEQKRRFQADPANRGKFIQSGLWRLSRHPNYFGEILLWAGIVLIAVPTLEGWRWLTLLSPFFVAVLLTRISGIPLLEQKADARWGGQPEYEAYKRETPVLFPRLW